MAGPAETSELVEPYRVSHSLHRKVVRLTWA